MKVYKGFTASPGLVLGQVSRLDRPPLVFGEGPFHPEQEKQALEDAIKVAQQELDEMAGRAAPSEQAIFLFQSMMLEDEGFMNEVAFQIKAGVGAAEAMDRVGRRYAAQLAAMKDNAYMQLRSVDILDVTQRITNILCHRLRSWQALDHPVILASDLLMPTDLFSVPAGRILGLITAEGSGQSHAAIIARSLNIPGITQVGEDFLKDCDGREVILNATEGECILDPDAAARQSAITRICELQRQNEELNAQLELPNRTRDGEEFELLANCFGPEDVGTAMSSGASGVGLSFVGDAPFEVAVGRAAENDDLPRGRVMTSEMEDRRRAVVLLQPLGEGHGPEQPFGRVALFVGRDACEMVVLHRFDVFAAAAGVQVGERFGPRRTLRRPGFARRSVVHPDKNACRCRE